MSTEDQAYKDLVPGVDLVLEGIMDTLKGALGIGKEATPKISIPWEDIARTHGSLVRKFAASGTVDKIKALRDIIGQFSQLESYAKKMNEPDLVKDSDRAAMRTLAELLKSTLAILKDNEGDKEKRLAAILEPLAREALRATGRKAGVKREEVEGQLDNDVLQNELLNIAHHLDDIEENLHGTDADGCSREMALSGVKDAKEAISRLTEFLPPEMAAEFARMGKADTEKPDQPEQEDTKVEEVIDNIEERKRQTKETIAESIAKIAEEIPEDIHSGSF